MEKPDKEEWTVKIGFVILHYNTIEETKECVSSIQEKIDQQDYVIVIVDNASPDGSGQTLKELYGSVPGIYVLCNDRNEGFARGNNRGYAFAREKLNCDFICCLNNDTKLLSEDFCEQIEKEYRQSGFAVCGPRVILRDGSDNYVYMKMPGRTELEEELKEYRRTLKLMPYHLDHFGTAWKMFRNQILRSLGKEVPSRYKKYYIYSETAERHEGILLHGCCLIFSPVYLEKFDDAFDPRTFLYREEEILWIRCQRAGLATVYTPEIRIWHKEDAATDSILRGKRDKIRFGLQNLADSLEIELKALDEWEEEKRV